MSSLDMHANNQAQNVLAKFPNTSSDTPQASHSYYVELTITDFPSHWNNGGIAYKIKNYIEFQHDIIRSTNSSETEDHWYSPEKCRIDSGETFPCEEIYFKKNTDIPLRYIQVQRVVFDVIRIVTSYYVISIGKPDDKYFESFPTHWYNECRDDNLGLSADPQQVRIDLDESKNIQVWLRNTPHKINGNNTVMVQWNTNDCIDCFKLTPEIFYFNGSNFQQKQILTIKRIKKGPVDNIYPLFSGGGYDRVDGRSYGFFIE